MYEASLETKNASIEQESLKLFTAATPISLMTEITKNEKNKMIANIKSLNNSIGKVCFIITDFLQVNNWRNRCSEKTEQELNIKAFELGVDWLKNNADLILALNVPFEILGWHQIIYDNFSHIKIHELFVKNSVEKTLTNIENWVSGFKKALSIKSIDLLENNLYTEYLNKTKLLIESSKIFEGKVKSSYQRLSRKEKNITPEIEENYKDYVLQETAVYWMWGEKKLFNCTIYKGDLNLAMEHIQSEILGETNFPHFKFKYEQIKKTIKNKNEPFMEGRFFGCAANQNLFFTPQKIYFNEHIANVIMAIAQIPDEKIRNSFFDSLLTKLGIGNTESQNSLSYEQVSMLNKRL